MTQFHERIAEFPLIFDENRARDVLDTLTKNSGQLADLIDQISESPRAARRRFLRLILSCLACAARP